MREAESTTSIWAYLF
ncbi:unnamed protein product [Gulo gulo]|uniref:Uncharacterized protein n=1 Tax=Gulo gulo TaxID=48420 RepID=A0A9X9Q6H3_GULGU|nr:unnamed protein product [Gulo gulo]